MNRRFSLATLLLLIAIVAIGLASARTALLRYVENNPAVPLQIAPPAIALVIMGAMVGLVYGCWLSIWNHGGALSLIAKVVGGPFLGAAAAAQLSVQTDWIVIFLTPIILVSLTTLVAFNRRRATARSAAHT
jgi:hypothetical protein